MPNLDRDFSEWHGGCSSALVWALDVDTAEVRARVGEAAGRLDDLLLSRYLRQPHITLAFAGLRPEPGATPAGAVYGEHDTRRDLAALRALGIAPFRVTVGGWGTFPMAPYLDASADALSPLRAVLPAPSRHPHVTVGLYAVEAELSEAEARMTGFAPPPLEVAVDTVCLMSYATDDIAGPLTTIGRLSLCDGTWTG
nr:2'-5' RNA ligase family protein [Tessaracoccus coleopterorum]